MKTVCFRSCLVLSIILLLGSFSLIPLQASRPSQSSIPRIGVRQVDGVGEFYNRASGERFVPRGSNYIDFKELQRGELWEDYIFGDGTYNPDKVRAEFAKLADYGYNTVRLIFDLCFAGPSCIGQHHGTGLNPVYLDHMVEVMSIAAEKGLYLILSTNGVPASGAYWSRYDPQFNENPAGFAQFYGNAYYLHAAGIAMQRHYWRDLLSGLAERHAPFEAVLAWQLQNEYFLFANEPPLSLESGQVTIANGQSYDMADPAQQRQMVADAVVFWIEELSTVVREVDPTGLVTVGFFVPDFPNEVTVAPGWYRDTASILNTAPVDFWDFHLYPDVDAARTPLHDLAENFGILGYSAKPVVMGEVGGFRHVFSSVELAVVRLQTWLAESCQYGFDGWLTWEHNIRPTDDDLFSMVENDDLMLKALAPVNWPDPCTSPPPLVESNNLALLRPVTVSAAHPDLPGSSATDGILDSEWAAGTHGEQWVEIDLQEARRINRIRMTVSQDPVGETHHRVWAIRTDGTHILLADWRQVTHYGDILEANLLGLLDDVRRIRVETLSSPSWVAWKEIEVYGDEAWSADVCLITASDTLLLRRAPGIDQEVVASFPPGTVVAATARMEMDHDDGWYHVVGGSWLREDTANATAACQNLAVQRAK